MTDLPQILSDLKDGTFQTADEKFKAMRGAGRPEDGYYLADGKRVPSSTTITGRFKDPGGLYHWHWNNGREGRKFGDGGTDALEIGSIVHDMVEAKLHGLPLPSVPENLVDDVASGYDAFREWWEGGRFEVVATEVPLVSEKYRFGGTLDCIIRDGKGRLCVADWKTSNGLYSDYLCQIASYGQLWNENCPEHLRLTGGFHLLRFSKQHGDFTHKYFPNLDTALRQFLRFREAYEDDKELKARAK